VPENYKIVPNQSTIELAVEDVEDENITADIKYQTVLIPVFDTESLASAVKGKSPADAKTTLMEFGEVQNVRIEVWPGWFPKFLQRMPRMRDRIEIVVSKA